MELKALGKLKTISRKGFGININWIGDCKHFYNISSKSVTRID